MLMNKVLFTKMSGAGNDFVFVDKIENPEFHPTPDRIKKICNRRYGVGADGLIEIENVDDYNFKMNYFNADGSTGSLCANGARCSIWFAENTGRLKNGKARFVAASNEYSGEVISYELVKFNLNAPQKIKFDFRVKAFGQMIKSNFADTGSPHIVINVNDIQVNPNNGITFQNIKDVPVYQIGKEIRYSTDFAPAGTNVNFVQVTNNEILIRTYERGVEDETLACGTGSVASAIICSVTHKLSPPITLKTYGGDKLIVNFDVENQKVNNPSITGPAKIVFVGSFDKNLFE